MTFLGVIWTNGYQNEGILSKATQLIQESNKAGLVHKIKLSNLNVFLSPGLAFQSHTLSHEQELLLLGEVHENSELSIGKNYQFNTNIDEIATRYWGNYIAVQSRQHKIEIFKDPVGHLPCYYFDNKEESCVIFTNELIYLFKLLALKPRLNQKYLLDFLVGLFGSPHLSSDSAFEGVYSIPQACCISFETSGTISSKLAWDVQRFVQTSDPFSALRNLEKIPETLQFVTKRLLKDKKNIFLDFSGGLDSTAILYAAKLCLSNGQTLKAINISHPTINSSNELIYAKKIAKELEIELIEYDISGSMPFSSVSESAFFPNMPDTSLVRVKIELDLINRFMSSGESLFIAGEGGDHLFMCPPAIESLCDSFLDRNFSGFFQKSKELSSIHRVHIWRILKVFIKNMFYYYNKRYPYGLDKLSETWFSEKLLEHVKLLKTFSHPCYQTDEKFGLQPGKFFQIEALFHALASVSGSMRGQYVSYPLLSQPIAELALSIPTYLMYNKTHDRFLFRKSISDYFNTDNVWRKSKGEVTGVNQLGIKENKTYILEKCLEGYLSKNKFINKDYLKQCIELSCLGQYSGQSIMNLVALESFVEAWKDF